MTFYIAGDKQQRGKGQEEESQVLGFMICLLHCSFTGTFNLYPLHFIYIKCLYYRMYKYKTFPSPLFQCG